MYALHTHDHGTPAADGQPVTLTIDGAEVTVPAGTSVMRAAAAAGGAIPKLCATDTLQAFGSCRVCLVEIEGQRGFPASCTTLVAPGMKVKTESDRLSKLRQGVVELYMSDHPEKDAAGERSELRQVASKLGMTTTTRYGKDGETHLAACKDESNPYFTFDPSACIVCSRCVRACNEVQGTFALTVEGRGFDSHIVASQAQPFFESECVSCGACVESCPTGALVEKTMIKAGPPAEVVTTTCAYCGVGCSFEAEVKGEEVVRMVPSRDGKANRGHACVKGRFAYGYATHGDRITKPMIRKQDLRSLARSQLGRGDRLRRFGVQADPEASTAASRWAASRRRAARTRKHSWCRSWCARRWAPTTSTPAPASAIRPRAMD